MKETDHDGRLFYATAWIFSPYSNAYGGNDWFGMDESLYNSFTTSLVVKLKWF